MLPTPTGRPLSDNPIYGAEERSAEEIKVIGRIRWCTGDLNPNGAFLLRGGSPSLRPVAGHAVDDVAQLLAQLRTPLCIEAASRFGRKRTAGESLK